MGEGDSNNARVNKDIDLMTMELTEPSEIVHGLGIPDLKELLDDVEPFLSIAKAKGAAGKDEYQYWSSLQVLCRHQLELQKEEERNHRHARRGDASIHKAVKSEVEELYKGKTVAELQQIEADIKTVLQNPDSSVDVDYLESSLKELVRDTSIMIAQ